MTNTWFVVPLPYDRHTINCKWVYKIKCKSNGTVERHKASLVSKGYTQQERLDFFDTLSHVAKLVIVKVLALWFIVQLDVNNAFLNGNLIEKVYMNLLGISLKFLIQNRGSVWCVNFINPYMGSNRLFDNGFQKFSTTLMSHGFHQSKSDYSLFTKGSGASFVALIVYVDDIIITGCDLAIINFLKTFFHGQFKLKDLQFTKGIFFS